MNNRDITILTLWNDEEIRVNISFENWLIAKNEAKIQGLDGILIKEFKRFVKFSNIKDEKGKTLYLSLPEPEKVKKELTEEERQKRDEFIKLCLEKSKEKRQENFVKKRQEILNNLAKKEEYWGMTTTLSKLRKLDYYIKKDLGKHTQLNKENN